MWAWLIKLTVGGLYVALTHLAYCGGLHVALTH